MLTAFEDAVVTTTTAETAMKFVGKVSVVVPVVAPFATVKLFSITSKPISVICLPVDHLSMMPLFLLKFMCGPEPTLSYLLLSI